MMRIMCHCLTLNIKDNEGNISFIKKYEKANYVKHCLVACKQLYQIKFNTWLLEH